MILRLLNCSVRSYTLDDAASLARYADNRKVWLNLRDGFPHPYSIDNANDFISRATSARPETNFAIDVGGEVVGGIGFVLHADIERISAEMGYWLAEPFWGRGITTEAVKALTAYAMKEHGLLRVYAVPFAENKASAKVLEKAGFVLEGVMRKSAIKDGRVLDQLLYAFVAE